MLFYPLLIDYSKVIAKRMSNIAIWVNAQPPRPIALKIQRVCQSLKPMPGQEVMGAPGCESIFV